MPAEGLCARPNAATRRGFHSGMDFARLTCRFGAKSQPEISKGQGAGADLLHG
jgi:hypothetical protein